VSNEGKEIKITDKRMFTPDGQLREEYRFLDEKATAAPAAEAGESGAAAAAAAPASAEHGAAPGGPPPDAGGAARTGRRGRAEPPERRDSATGGRRQPDPASRELRAAPEGWETAESAGASPYGDPTSRLEIPGSPPGTGPSFYDLAAMLAEPVPIYLGDVDLPDGQSAENLEMARLYIDLLDVLRQKTAGNLTAQESAFLEDLLYRLRVRYVQKRG